MSKLLSHPAHLLKRGRLAILTVLFAVVVLVLGVFSLASAAHAASPCNEYKQQIDGARAEWITCVNPGSLTVSGSVQDTKKDGYCGEVYAYFENNVTHKIVEKSQKACGAGTIKRFHWGPLYASRVTVKLRLG